MVERKVLGLEEIQAFLDASEEIGFEGKKRKEVYEWVRQTLVAQQYHVCGKVERGLLRNYVGKMTGLSRAQVTRLVSQYLETGNIAEQVYRRQRFPSVYTRADTELLATVDEAHETLSGPATQKILYREYHDYGNGEYERLARISAAHIYNLRGSSTYRKRWMVYQKTKPVSVGIGERRKPEPRGRPGYLRVDTVHQGDREGVKGVYHITAVDEVTQWQVMGATEQISEVWLLPVLEAMVEQFPFAIRGYHSDNGSEYINNRVAKMLEKLLAEQTKSRPRRSTDNGLVESKNGAVVRKHMGYGYIAAEHAEAINEFYQEHFNPYLNFHRPCRVPAGRRNATEKDKRVYRWSAPTWENLRPLPDLARHLKEELTVMELNKMAALMSDTAAAQRMQKEKKKLFARLHGRRSA